MSKFVVYLDVKPFVREWMEYHYGKPAEFPSGSAENATIRRFLTRLPAGEQPYMGTADSIAVSIPDSKQKPVASYNHLGKHARAAVVECIEDTFRLQMWRDLNDLHESGCSILKAVRAWCEMNGISTDHDYTLKARYQRMREAYLKKGIDLRNVHRNHDDD